MRLRNSPLRCTVISSADLRLGERRAGGRSDDLLPYIRRLENHVFLMAVHRSRVEADAGNLLEIAGRGEDVKSAAGAAADLIGAVGAGQRERPESDRSAPAPRWHGLQEAQWIGNGSMHNRGLGRAANENQAEDQEERDGRMDPRHDRTGMEILFLP